MTFNRDVVDIELFYFICFQCVKRIDVDDPKECKMDDIRRCAYCSKLNKKCVIVRDFLNCSDATNACRY